jgi:molybdopterin synthase catalytic subunit
LRIEIVQHIDINEASRYLQADNCGAINLFVGTVRNHATGKPVIKLEFEAYEPMAIKEMKIIAAKAMEKWPLEKVILLHVTGEKSVGEAVVLTGVSSPHRQAGFEACQFLIDELKRTVPIWKKEYYADSSIWVNAHP